MSYDKTVALAARAELERRRSRAQETARQNLEDFLSRCPRAGEIRRELSANATGAARAVVHRDRVSAAVVSPARMDVMVFFIGFFLSFRRVVPASF